MATVAILVGVGYAVIDFIDAGPSLVAGVPAGTREAFFASLAATSGALLGFAITGLTILLTLGGGARLKWLMRQERFKTDAPMLFTTAIGVLGVATGVFLLLIVVATDKDSFWDPWGYLALIMAALVAERVGRLIRFFHRLMLIAFRDADETPLPNPAFKEPLDD
jgi:hypothetical protein